MRHSPFRCGYGGDCADVYFMTRSIHVLYMYACIRLVFRFDLVVLLPICSSPQVSFVPQFPTVWREVRSRWGRCVTPPPHFYIFNW